MRRIDRKITDKPEIIEIFEKADSCQIGLVDGEYPYIITMNFGYLWENEFPVLFFHCAHEGKKIEIIKKNQNACFTISIDHELVKGDKACDFGMKYKSIIGNGKIEIVSNADKKKKCLGQILKKFTGKSDYEFDLKELEKTTVLMLTTIEMQGKQKK